MSPTSIRGDTPNSIPLPLPSLCIAVKEFPESCLEEMQQRANILIPPMVEYTVGCWPKENNRMGGCYPGLGACHLKRQNIDKGDLKKPHVISGFGFISVCCLRRSAQIQTANITVPSCRAQSQFRSSRARKNMKKYE